MLAEANGSNAILGVLHSASKYIECSSDDAFKKTSEELLEAIQTIFSSSMNQHNAGNIRRIKTLAQRAWRALPSFVQDTFAPDSDTSVLISADPYYTKFPWEALCFGINNEGLPF